MIIQVLTIAEMTALGVLPATILEGMSPSLPTPEGPVATPDSMARGWYQLKVGRTHLPREAEQTLKGPQRHLDPQVTREIGRDIDAELDRIDGELARGGMALMGRKDVTNPFAPKSKEARRDIPAQPRAPGELRRGDTVFSARTGISGTVERIDPSRQRDPYKIRFSTVGAATTVWCSRDELCLSGEEAQAQVARERDDRQAEEITRRAPPPATPATTLTAPNARSRPGSLQGMARAQLARGQTTLELGNVSVSLHDEGRSARVSIRNRHDAATGTLVYYAVDTDRNNHPIAAQGVEDNVALAQTLVLWVGENRDDFVEIHYVPGEELHFITEAPLSRAPAWIPSGMRLILK